MDHKSHSSAARIDPVRLVGSLDPDALRRQLRAVEADRRALLVLLRAALAAGRKPARASDDAESDAAESA